MCYQTEKYFLHCKSKPWQSVLISKKTDKIACALIAEQNRSGKCSEIVKLYRFYIRLSKSENICMIKSVKNCKRTCQKK